ncbi:MAG: hypothetical protein ACRYFS_09240 [Janthinobacterium lividum]
MKRAFAALLLLAAVGISPLRAASPEDIVPQGSGLYDAVALLAAQHLLPPGAPDATSLEGVTARLYTRREFAGLIEGITNQPGDPRAASALAFARNILAPELADAPILAAPVSTPPVLTGFGEVEAGGRSNTGTNLHGSGDLLGRARLLGTLGRDGAYTVSLTNIYTQTRDHLSVNLRGDGHTGGDNPDELNGIDEAYVTAVSNRGFRVTAGKLRQRWGSGYLGDMLVSDNSPARPTLEIELPFSLGHVLGDYRYTQFESLYRNSGQDIYEGGRRLEHPIGDRTTLSVEEAYTSNQFRSASVLALPYYAYQKIDYANVDEPSHFNYNFNLGLTVTPHGPNTSQRFYGQFLIDDLQAPKGLGKGNITPRKIGYLLGYAQTFDRSGTDLVLEYAHTDQQTYTKVLPLPTSLAWFNGDLPIGYPSGTNGNQVYARLGQRLTSRLDLSLEGRDRQRASADFPAVNARSLDLGLAYHLGVSQSIGFQYSDYHEDPYPGAVLPAGDGTGGADYGQLLRRHIVAVSFLQGF